MKKITFINENKIGLIKPYESILQAALKQNIDIRHKCGGKGSCTTCKIKIRVSEQTAYGTEKSPVSAPSRIERRLLGELQLQNGFRLACQTKVHQNIQVETIEDPLKAIIRRQLQALKETEED